MRWNKNIGAVLIVASCVAHEERKEDVVDVAELHEIEIELEIVDAAASQDIDDQLQLLGETSFRSKFSTDGGLAKRGENIRLTASKINGIRVKPGEEFSFNKAVGDRTAENGFAVAPVLFEGVKQPGIGGGICQVSGTLYAALMYGGFTIKERHSHSRPVAYLSIGMDATVNWPDLDLRFVNNDASEIVLFAETLESGRAGELKVSIRTKEQRETARTVWKSFEEVQFGVREIRSKYAKKKKLHQEGKRGTPGYRVWQTKRSGVHVKSEYKPILEIVIVPAGDSVGVNLTE